MTKTDGVVGRWPTVISMAALLAAVSAWPDAGFAAPGDGAFDASTQAELAQADESKAFNLPAQPLGQSLVQFGTQSGVQVAVDADAVAGKTAPALSGRMTPREALARLLTGSGLVYQFTSAGAVSIEAPEGMTLAPITVEGKGMASTTEGSTSYTTGPMATATRLPLTIRETPQAVTVVTRQQMDDAAMTDIADVVRDTPGLYLSGSDGVARPAIRSRGFFVNNIIQDGLRVSHSSYIPTTLSSLAMYDRVEVVRGATGLFKGAGNPSAAINMVRKRPTQEFETKGEAYTGSWDKVGGFYDVGGGLTENGSIRARGVVALEDSKNFRVTEENDRKLFYGILEADINADTSISIGAHQQKDNRSGGWWYSLPITLTGTHYGFDRKTSFASDWEYLDQRSTTVFAELEHQLTADWKASVKAQGNWMMTDGLGTYLRYDLAGANGYRIYAWSGVRSTDIYTLDATADGSFDLFGRKHDLIVGASHTRKDELTENYSSGYIANNIDIFNFSNSSIARPSQTFTSDSRNVVTEDAVYATARFSVLDPLSLIAGARLDWYDYDDRRGTSDYYVKANLTQYAGIVLDIDENHSTYVSYTDIFSPQSSVDVSGKLLDPIVGKNYEIGVKGEYFGGALNATAAVFRIDQENRAVTVDDTSTCTVGTSCATASGLVRSQGVELEVQGAITNRWEVGAGYSFAKAEYIKDKSNAKGAPFDTKIPEHTFKLSTAYRFGGDLEGWRVGGQVSMQSSIYADGTTNGVAWRNAQNPYGIADLMVGYKPVENVDVQLNINNIFDNTYYQTIGTNSDWGSVDTYGPPRNFMLKAKMTF